MTDISAALGLAQLRRYDGLLARRREIIAIYNSAFSGTCIAPVPHDTACGSGSGHLYITRIDGIDESRRNEIITKMAEAGIATNVHYKPLAMFEGYKALGFDISDYPNAYDLYRNEISLPLHTLLTDEEAKYVADKLKEIVGV